MLLHLCWGLTMSFPALLSKIEILCALVDNSFFFFSILPCSFILINWFFFTEMIDAAMGFRISRRTRKEGGFPFLMWVTYGDDICNFLVGKLNINSCNWLIYKEYQKLVMETSIIILLRCCLGATLCNNVPMQW